MKSVKNIGYFFEIQEIFQKHQNFQLLGEEPQMLASAVLVNLTSHSYKKISEYLGIISCS